jgi:hypothetical protein
MPIWCSSRLPRAISATFEVIREREDNGFATISIPALMSVLPVDPDTYVRASILLFGNDFLPELCHVLAAQGWVSPRDALSSRDPDSRRPSGDEIKVLRKHATGH